MDFTADSVAMFVPAPGLFSTTTGCPIRSVRASPTNRAMVSVDPPGAKPTSNRIGRDGKACADAGARDRDRMAGAAIACMSFRREIFMPPSSVSVRIFMLARILQRISTMVKPSDAE